jgi:hypothetical protein
VRADVPRLTEGCRSGPGQTSRGNLKERRPRPVVPGLRAGSTPGPSGPNSVPRRSPPREAPFPPASRLYLVCRDDERRQLVSDPPMSPTPEANVPSVGLDRPPRGRRPGAP